MDLFDKLSQLTQEYNQDLKQLREQDERVQSSVELFPSIFGQYNPIKELDKITDALHPEQHDEHYQAREVEPKQSQPNRPLAF